MNSLMEYKGYHAKIEYSDEDKTFVGRVIGINDVLAFDGENISELNAMFRETVDDYLEMCSELGQNPDKEYKGNFNIRIKPELHKQACLKAESQGKTLNQFVATAIENEIQGIHGQTSTTIILPTQSVREYIPDQNNMVYSALSFSRGKEL